jgi:23S rRNA (adenine-N6)-dimethyltransferase
VSGRRPPAPNPAGAHFLHDRSLIAQLVRAAGAGEGRLVLDLGAGGGAITARLAQAGARVIAVERDPRLAARLRRRFDGEPRVRVVEADLRRVKLPRREFLVVASPPFSLTTALLRRLLGDPAVRLAAAELIIQDGAARWLASPRPRDAETAWWTARYRVRVTATVSPASFTPPPGVVAARLSIRPRGTPAPAERQLRALLRSAYHRPGTRAETALAATGAPGGRRLLIRAGIAPGAAAEEVTAEQWHRLALLLAGPGAAPHRQDRRGAGPGASPHRQDRRG